MKKTLYMGLVIGALGASAADAAAQGFGVAARAGLVGIGLEGAVSLAPRVQARAGFGILPFEPDPTIDDIVWRLEVPRSWYNIGLDIYLAGELRVGGGVLFKPDDPTLEATPTSAVDIGGRTFTPLEIGTLKGTLASRTKAPYAILGVGKMTGRGLGLFVDVGVALLGDPHIQLEAEGGSFSDLAELRSRLDAEATRLESSAPDYIRYWPFLSVGVKLGLG